MSRIKRISAFAAVMIVSLALFAGGAAERKAEFSSLDFSSASISDIEKSYEKAVSAYEETASRIEKKSLEAWEKRDVEAYLKLMEMSRALDCPIVTEEMTETLKTRLLNTSDENEREEIVSFLYDNSIYYQPVLTLTMNADSGNSSLSWTTSVSVKPGETVTLPLTASFAGKMVKGWGITKDEVKYTGGEEIKMPYDDTVLYAILADGISFSDSVTGYSFMTEEKSASVVTPDASDPSLVFSGWYDENSRKAEGDTVTRKDGESLSYTALWKGLKFSEGSVRYYSLDSVPSGVQVLYRPSFSVGGNSELKDVTFTLENSDGVSVLDGNVKVRRLSPSDEYELEYTIVLSGESGETVSTDLTARDRDGNEWTMPVSFTIR